MSAIFTQTTQYKFWSLLPSLTTGNEGDRNLAQRLELIQIKRNATEDRLLSLSPTLLTSSEIATYHCFMEFRIQELVNKAFNLSPNIIAVAISFYKRFYLIQSLSKHDPKFISVMCVFLAMKCENVHMGLQEFASKLRGIEADHLRPLELILLSTLRFHLAVVLPHESILGLVLNFQHFRNSSSQSYNVDDTIIMQKAFDYATKSIQTDLLFVSSPAQIAVACFELTIERLSQKTALSPELLQQYLESCIYSNLQHLEAFKVLIKDMKKLISNVHKPDTALIKDIDNRITTAKSRLASQ